MREVYSNAWNSLENYINTQDDYKLNGNKELFVKDCKDLENIILADFMTSNSFGVDRHKAAAIITTILSSNGYISSVNEIKDDEVDLGKYIISLYVALSFMEDNLNYDLNKCFNSSIEKFGLYIPDPVICNTSGINNLARLLYWEDVKKVDKAIKVFELANTFFLYEQLTLLMNDIDIEEWKAFRQS